MDFNNSINYLNNSKDKWIFILSLSMFSAFFLLYFQPFGINNFDPKMTLTPALINAITLFTLQNCIVLAINEFIVKPVVLNHPTFKTLMLWLVWSCLLVSSTTFLLYNWLGEWHDMKFTSYLGFILDLSLMLSIPISAVLLYFNYRSAQQKIDALNQNTTESNYIIFTSSNKKELLRVAVEDLLYLEGQENYVAVHYLYEEQPTKKLLRSTMQRMEENLNATPILRCHRSFFINSTKIIKINRQLSQFTVSLKGVNLEIPVSEKFQHNIIDKYNI